MRAVLLAAFVATAVTLAFSSYVLPDPLQQMSAPVGRSLGLSSGGPCPRGWIDRSLTAEHHRVLACEQGGWLVVLSPSGDFERALHLDTPGADWITDSSLVPGWPR